MREKRLLILEKLSPLRLWFGNFRFCQGLGCFITIRGELGQPMQQVILPTICNTNSFSPKPSTKFIELTQWLVWRYAPKTIKITLNTVWGYVPERGEILVSPTHPTEVTPVGGTVPISWGALDKLYQGGWKNTTIANSYMSVFRHIPNSLEDRVLTRQLDRMHQTDSDKMPINNSTRLVPLEVSGEWQKKNSLKLIFPGSVN